MGGFRRLHPPDDVYDVNPASTHVPGRGSSLVGWVESSEPTFCRAVGSEDFTHPTMSIPHQHTFLEEVRGQLDAGCLEARDERRPHAGGFKLAVRTAVLVDAELFEFEDILHDDDILL